MTTITYCGRLNVASARRHRGHVLSYRNLCKQISRVVVIPSRDDGKAALGMASNVTANSGCRFDDAVKIVHETYPD
jgi:hypothetical protein